MVVSPLKPGLNIITGANEAGKSTLLRAVRSALFDRSKSVPVTKKCRPYNDNKAQPEVRLIFDLHNEEYQFRKCFSSKECIVTLTNNKERWEGPEAEEHLARLLGFDYAKKGVSKPELQGLASLLWVDQAHAWQAVKVSDQARNRLQAVFGSEVKKLLSGGQGEALLDRVRELREQYLTTKRNEPRGRYKELQEKKEELAQKLKQTQQELTEYKERCHYLNSKQKELDDYHKENSAVQAENELQQAQARQRQVQELKEQRNSARKKLELKQAELELAREKQQKRQQLVEKLQDDSDQEKEAGEKQQSLREAMEPIEAELQILRQEHTRRQYEYSASEQQLRVARDARELAEKTRGLESLKKTLEEARKAEEQARECTTRRDSIPVTSKVISNLRKVERRRSLAAERLNSASTVLEYRLEKHVSVQLDDATIFGDGQIQLTESTSLKIEGTGTLKIIPGGHELHQRRREAESTEREFQSILSEAGSDSLVTAERAHKQRETLVLETSLHEERVLALAPAGTPDLEKQTESLKVQCETLRQNLEESNGNGDRKVEEISPTVELQDLKRLLQKRQNLLKRAEKKLESCEKQVQQQRDQLLEAKIELYFKKKQVEATRDILQEERKREDNAHLQESFQQAERKWCQEERELDRLDHSLEEAHPETVDLEAQRKEKILEQARKRGENLERAVHDLKVELNTLVRRGMTEEQAKAESAYLVVENLLRQTEREAQAIDLLHRLLQESRQRTREYVTKPVADKLTPYLKQLLPAAAPDINEELALNGIHRNDVHETFENLSIGTREQLAVLVRLAYADLLSAEKQLVTVIFDDPLTNSDEERHERMNAILYRAAQNYQILLFTCHPSAYRNSGGHFISLEDCKAKG